MKPHDELVAAIQIGTRRATLPPAEVLPEYNARSQEWGALVMAGVLDLMIRAGAKPSEGVRPLSVAPIEEAPIAVRSAEPLHEALNGNLTGPVLEWAVKAKQLGKVAPHSTLVWLLPLAQRHREELLPVLGSRGRWIAVLQGIELDSGSQLDFRARRKADPSGYREWLAAELDAMDWKDRVQAISAMRVSLSIEDEPLLELALADRRKEVREPACELLASLAGSRVMKELSGLALAAIRLEKSFLSKSLAVDPPDPASLPKWLPRTPSRTDFGPKALALFDVVRFRPPSILSSEVSPEQFIALAEKTDYARVILDGLQEAALNFDDQAWIDVLFEYLATRSVMNQECWPGLARSVSEVVFVCVMSAKLKGNVDNQNFAAMTLVSRKKPLELELSRNAITAFRENASLHYYLRDLANFLHPSAVTLVTSSEPGAEYFESTREHLFKVLNLRSRLLASLD